ncbi:MAG: DUF11 domain-containing protein [Candidatus Obscuribacterales bacterium]|nr:DUF11 domain-containing protein [Steroidobacteraceae bacterium]
MQRALHWLLALVLLLVGANEVHAQAISRYTRETGNINYVATGGSLRAATNNTNPCSVNATSTQALTGIPVGATIRAAYLYWGGSGPTPDNNVTLNGSGVTASRTFSAIDTATGLNWRFFGGFANVTSLVTGNGSFTFGGLTVTNTGNYCGGATASGVVSGWSLIVIYQRASESLRAINVFDGLDFFYGSSISRISDGFRIPPSAIDGKMTVVTWEGDITNSGAQGGFSESLQFNGNTLGSLSYDSLSYFAPGSPGTTSHGVDIDTYDISSFLAPGQTTATSVYSSGADFVLLTAKIVSVTSEPIVDLTIAKSHVGNFAVGTNGVYSITVSNLAGSQPTDFPITVTDTLPTGLSYVSGTGTGWSCGATGQVVTCTHPGSVTAANSLPVITLTVAVGNAAFPSVTNNATVNTPSFDPNAANNSASDVTTVLGPNLSTSTKTVQDLNGGDANPGDTLRYTITIIESAGVAASGVSVTDDIPGNVSSFNVVSTPVGAVNNSTNAPTGNNGTGFLNIANISVPASGSVTVVFDVQVAAGASPGTAINNTATVINPAGTDPTPSAPAVIVSASQIPGSGSKQLYLWSNPSQTLDRRRPSGTHNPISINGNNASTSWTITPALQTPVTLQAGNFLVPLLLTKTGSNNTSRTIRVTLSNSVLGQIATAVRTIDPMPTAVTLTTFTLNTPSVTAPAGSAFTLTINNNSANTTNRSISLTPYSGANYSRVELNSATVINVDSVNTYNAVYPGGAITTNFMRGLSTVYVRAVVSDPFGSFDITSATVTLIDANSATPVSAQAMTMVNDSGVATKTYQYSYAVPSNAAAGAWTIQVTANEGVEGVTDLGVGSFNVTIPLPTLQISKISEVLSDPVNGVTNPKRIPNSLLRFTITVTNTGPGGIDASSLALTDVMPANTSMYVDTSLGDPVEFIDGTTASGLSFNYASNVNYSSAGGGGAPFTYTPAADANGVDISVTGLRVAPTGAMPGASGLNQPSFTLRFRVRVR